MTGEPCWPANGANRNHRRSPHCSVISPHAEPTGKTMRDGFSMKRSLARARRRGLHRSFDISGARLTKQRCTGDARVPESWHNCTASWASACSMKAMWAIQWRTFSGSNTIATRVRASTRLPVSGFRCWTPSTTTIDPAHPWKPDELRVARRSRLLQRGGSVRRSGLSFGCRRCRRGTPCSQCRTTSPGVLSLLLISARQSPSDGGAAPGGTPGRCPRAGCRRPATRRRRARSCHRVESTLYR